MNSNAEWVNDMKFLLVGINAKYIHSNPAIYSLKAYAGEDFKENIELAEYTINHRREEILSDLYKRRPDCIGFSCYIWNFQLIRELLEDIPKVLPQTEIWLGGPEVSFDGPELLDAYPAVRGIMTGEGEATFRELLKYYTQRADSALSEGCEDEGGEGDKPAFRSRTCEDGVCSGKIDAKGLLKELLLEDGSLQEQEDAANCRTDDDSKLKQIQGLILRGGRTGEREALSLDELPFLYDRLEDFQNKIIYYESSRGCPFRCSYCLSAIDKTVRLRSMDKVKKELQFFLDGQVPQVKFIDRTFNCNHAHALEIWQYIKEHDNGVTNFHFEIAADIMTEEELKLLSSLRPGLVQLEIGVQSTNEVTLREINRFVHTDHIAEVVRRLKESENIHIHLDLIAGLPYEDYESFIRSFDEVYAMQPQQLQLGFLKVLKGSPMAEKADGYGILYQERIPYEVLSTRWLSYEQVLKLKRVEEMVEIYYNSNQFRHILPVLKKEFSGAFAMFAALADYYEKKGYFVNAPARSSRYEILLSFACEQNADRAELYKELLTFDFYLREKAKSRPVYAPDQEKYRDDIWDFYCKEESDPQYLPAYREYHARQTMKMTHMEIFHYPVWMTGNEKITDKMTHPSFILFDYQKRDPLTGDAWYQRILR